MKRLFHFIAVIAVLSSVAGCASRPKAPPPAGDSIGRQTAIERVDQLSPRLKNKVLALNPGRVKEKDVRGILSQLPAPRIISIHGGLLPIQSSMNSFADFLIGMGYPLTSLQHPGNGKFAYGHYDEAEEIAGTIAWYYEQDGLRPMIVGHSLGGIQAVRVLYELAGNPVEQLHVWNPVTGTLEDRIEFLDPLTGSKRPVVGLKLPYASAALSGGIARIIPGEWDMSDKLREIPDSVEEFTGFQKGFDMAGGDLMGYGDGNDYHATGGAQVRNVRIPSFSAHWTLTYAKTILDEPEMLDWINEYQPTVGGAPESAPDPGFGMQSGKVIWAADVWYSIKKHWVLELQRLIRSRGKSST